MLAARLIILTSLASHALAAPSQLARRGKFPWEVLNQLAQVNEAAVEIVTPLFTAVGIHEYRPTLDASVSQLRKLVDLAQSTKEEERQLARAILDHWQQEVNEMMQHSDQGMRNKAAALLERLEHAKRPANAAVAMDEATSLSPLSESGLGSKLSNAVKKVAILGAVVGGLAGTLYGASCLATESEGQEASIGNNTEPDTTPHARRQLEDLD